MKWRYWVMLEMLGKLGQGGFDMGSGLWFFSVGRFNFMWIITSVLLQLSNYMNYDHSYYHSYILSACHFINTVFIREPAREERFQSRSGACTLFPDVICNLSSRHSLYLSLGFIVKLWWHVYFMKRFTFFFVPWNIPYLFNFA